MSDESKLKICAVLLILLVILYALILCKRLARNKKMSAVGRGEAKQKMKHPTELIERFDTVSKTSKVDPGDLDNLPFQDGYQQKLESGIKKSFDDYQMDTDPFPGMINYLKSNIKYRRRCLPIVIRNGKIACITPNPKAKVWGRDGVDERVFVFIKMMRDLDKWCKAHKLPLPESRFIIYVADTYAWEETAKDYPWLTMAKPINRPGILIPDNSFITHNPSGGHSDTDDNTDDKTDDKTTSTINWQWDNMIAKSKELAPPVKNDILFFKGANTGTYKFATRQYLSKYSWELPITIDLQGGKESMFRWNKFIGLLNLPGNQPWSYRLKYLYLLNTPVVNVDVLLRYDPKHPEDSLGRWIQFFDPIFAPDDDYVQISQVYYDNKNLKDFAKLKMESFKNVVKDVKKSYKFISDPKTSGKMATQSYEKITQMTSSRILQYLYMTIVGYANKFNY